jgi:hypothetical protein
MIRTTLRVASLFGIAAALAGCDHWLARRETISYQAGDAVAWNRAVHTIDPWPAASADTTIPLSGRRVTTVIERYESGVPEETDASSGATSQITPAAQ